MIQQEPTKDRIAMISESIRARSSLVFHPEGIRSSQIGTDKNKSNKISVSGSLFGTMVSQDKNQESTG